MAFVVGDDCLPRAGLLNGPTGGVHAAVVETAEEDQVLGGSQTTIGPMLDMVGFGPGDRAVAALPGAPVLLFEFEFAAEGRVGKAGRSAEFYGFTGGVVEDRGDDPGLAGQQAGPSH